MAPRILPFQFTEETIMSKAVRYRSACLVFIGMTLPLPAADEPVSRGQIVKSGKAATALVLVKGDLAGFVNGGGSASAFCIHPSGLFLTNEHVVRPPAFLSAVQPPMVLGGADTGPGRLQARMEITLVLNPGQKTEKSYPAQVIRRDEKLDLALLRIDGVKDPPTLPLGSDEGLEELMEVIALGFPFSDFLSQIRAEGFPMPGEKPGPRQNPAVSLNEGKITALRHKGDQLDRIQFDAAINPGNSGGPVLDKNGKVVGVVVSGIRVGLGIGGATGINHAIPVSHVRRFLARPEVLFIPPKLEVANMYKPVSFEACVTHFVPAKASTRVELILKSSNGPDRTYPMQAAGDTYRITAAPLPPPSTAYPIRVLAQFDNGTLSATASDRTFKVGDGEKKLSEVRELHLGSKPWIVHHDGKRLEAALSGLEATPIRLGSQTLRVDLTKATEVKLGPAAEDDHVSYTLLVRQGDQEVFRQSDSLIIHGLLPLVIAGKPFTCIDIQAKANYKLKGEQGDQGSNLAPLPTGRQILADVPFQVGPAMIQVGLNSPSLQLPNKVEGIRVDRPFSRLHILHATHQADANGTLIGEYTVTWADGAIATIPIRYGKDLLDWWYDDRSAEPTEAKVAWRGYLDPVKHKIRLYVMTWENPKPNAEVKTIAFAKAGRTRCVPFCVAMTVEGK
jgi:hypothetical protein